MPADAPLPCAARAQATRPRWSRPRPSRSWRCSCTATRARAARPRRPPPRPLRRWCARGAGKGWGGRPSNSWCPVPSGARAWRLHACCARPHLPAPADPHTRGGGRHAGGPHPPQPAGCRAGAQVGRAGAGSRRGSRAAGRGQACRIPARHLMPPRPPDKRRRRCPQVHRAGGQRGGQRRRAGGAAPGGRLDRRVSSHPGRGQLPDGEGVCSMIGRDVGSMTGRDAVICGRMHAAVRLRLRPPHI